ncbi:MAG: bifunctional phosphoglucose/phosphomannose isomerase [Dehalococcoidia bacterium]|nr:bifunctional phosphoglucose/phosphomannose isomerase [Dehalococcoidia bacterium]
MHPLDQPSTYSSLDPSGVRGRIRDLPSQCRQAWDRTAALSLPDAYRKATQVVVLGMGGSAIGGDLLRDAVSHECLVPVRVLRDYSLPADVRAGSLVIGSSYSGETEETLTAFAEASKRGCHLVVAAGGGHLRSEAERRGLPFLAIQYVGEPRSVLGYGFFLLLGLLHRLGLISDKSQDLEDMERALEALDARLEPGVPLDTNPAKELASLVHNHIAVIYGGGILEAIARRWKGQMNENGKNWAFFESFPELNHNAVVGYDLPQDIASRMLVIMLHSDYLHPRVKKRYQVTQEILAQKGVAFRVVNSEGSSIASQMMSSVFFGDFTSYYLALLNGVDPSPVATITFLKERLKSIDSQDS